MIDEIWSTAVSEFSDIPDVSTTTRIALRLALAALLGGILGYERERKGRSAGVRTHMLVAVGAALFVIGPTQSGMPIEDMSRVLQGIVQGIGFLGAGAIIVRSAKNQVEGLTTAANLGDGGYRRNCRPGLGGDSGFVGWINATYTGRGPATPSIEGLTNMVRLYTKVESDRVRR